MENHFKNILAMAAKQQASDIYILPDGAGYQVKCYTPKGIVALCQLADVVGAALIRHVKFASQMDISEGRRPQLGRLTYQLDDEWMHLRISSVGDFLNRESVVIRLIHEVTTTKIRWQKQTVWPTLTTVMNERQGLFLIAGAMGVGKTTTLHYLAHQLLKGKMVLTIEDPVEIVQANFLQLQVNEQANMNYATLLKLALRHHPEVILIGEIRDAQTAKIAIEASLSGHLILSTIHASSLSGIWHRLISFGIPSVLLKQVLVGLAHQTLTFDQDGPLAQLEIAHGHELTNLINEVSHETDTVVTKNTG